MSAYVRCLPYGEGIYVTCPECNISHPYDTWRQANLNCRAHNVFHHVDSIRWESL